MLRVLILAVVLAAGFPAVAQTPASDPPPSSAGASNTEQKPQEAQPSSEQSAQGEQSVQTDKQAAQNEEQNAQDESSGQDDASGKKEEKKGALGRLKRHVKDHFSTGCAGAGTAAGCWGGKDGKGEKGEQQKPSAEKNPPPPRSTDDAEVSSSRDTQIDLNPPGQERPARKPAPAPDDVQEMKHYDPHAAEKDIEVGEYYLKAGNVKAALARFRSALHNKRKDALATFRLAQALEKGRQLLEAREYYQKYLQTLPKGEFATDCQKALERLPTPVAESAEAPPTSAPAETPPSKR
ncbi:MAG: tetratricopeptide repeat protein [Terriglobales bacterium]